MLRKRLQIPRTHSDTGINRKERTSAEILKVVGKSFNLKKQKMKKSTRILGLMQKLGKTSGLFKEISFIVIILKREFNDTCREKNHSLSHKKYIIERKYSKKKCTIREER